MRACARAPARGRPSGGLCSLRPLAPARFRAQYDVVNDYGERAFFPAASLYTALVIVIFTFTCVGGTVFRRAVPFETPFYQPRMRPEDSKRCAYFCWEPTCFTMGILGP